MTTDADPTEQIAREMYYSEKPEERHRNGWNTDHPDEKWRFRDLAAAVLPILRRAQADAYEEGAQAQADTYGGQIDTGPNPYRTEQTNG